MIKITKKNHKEIEAKAVFGFLVRYTGESKKMYAADLRICFAWFESQGIIPMLATRVDIELFGRHLEEERKNKPASVRRRLGVVQRFYELAHADGVIPTNPGKMVRLPKAHYDESARFGLTRLEMGLLIEAAVKRSPIDGALVCLMVVMGLRVSTALSFNVGDLEDLEHGHRVLRYMTKNKKIASTPIPVPVARLLDAAAKDRSPIEPLIARRSGIRMDRHAAYARLKIIVRLAGLPEDKIHPHTLRGSAITAALDTGISVRDVQQFANHADARTTLRYDNNARNLDKHPAYALSSLITL